MSDARGNFRINLNKSKKSGDNQPVFDRGVISTPDDAETQFEFKLWAYRDKNGHPFYAGPSSNVSTTATALERAEAMSASDAAAIDTSRMAPDGTGVVQLGAHQVMMFPNGYKLKTCDARYDALSDDEKALNAKRPDVWGYWNPGNGKAQLKIAAWDIDGRYGPFLGGNTQVPQPGRNIATEASPIDDAAHKAKAKGRRAEARE